MAHLGADQWQTTALKLTNVTTGSLLMDAAVDNPTALTEVQTFAGATDAYLASAWTDSNINVSIDSIGLSHTPIPEPASAALLALAGLAMIGLRRHG